MDNIIGIDPGLTGAIAFLRSGEGIDGAEVHDAPTLWAKVGKRRRRYLIESEMVKIVEERLVPGARWLAAIEWAQPMPKQGVTSVFSYGQGFGTWLGILAALGIPVTKIRPQTWRREMLRDNAAPAEKNTSRHVAQLLFPEVDLGARADNGRAEALLIAAYARRTWRSGEPTVGEAIELFAGDGAKVEP